MQVAPNTCNISPLKKIFFKNKCIFQISLKYKKLVIPKILFILVLCNFNFFSKLCDLPKILFLLALCKFNFFKKIMWPPSNTTPSPQAGRGGGWVHSISCICTWNKLIKAKAISPLTFFFFKLFSDFNTYLKSRHQSCSIKKTVPKIFGIFIGKHLCWSLFLLKLETFCCKTCLYTHT